MTPASSLVLQNSPSDSCPCSSYSEVSKETTFSYTPGPFQTAVCMLYLSGVGLLCCLLRMGTQFPTAPWFFQSRAC